MELINWIERDQPSLPYQQREGVLEEKPKNSILQRLFRKKILPLQSSFASACCTLHDHLSFSLYSRCYCIPTCFYKGEVIQENVSIDRTGLCYLLLHGFYLAFTVLYFYLCNIISGYV